MLCAVGAKISDAEEEIYTFRRRERGGEKFPKGVRWEGRGERGGSQKER